MMNGVSPDFVLSKPAACVQKSYRVLCVGSVARSLLNAFSSLESLPAQSLESFMYQIMLSVDRDMLTFSFPTSLYFLA